MEIVEINSLNSFDERAVKDTKKQITIMAH